MKKISLLFICSLMSAFSMDAYKIFYKDSSEVSFSQLVDSAATKEIVLFGEQHNAAISHWLQLQLAKNLKEKGDLIIGAEMFEADDQQKIEELKGGFIRMKDFEKEAKVWNNFAIDYKPVFEFAINNDIDFIATNIPRRYASMVARKGLDTLKKLPGRAKDYLPKLPIEFDPELPAYAAMSGMAGHGMDFIVEAQAIKDATMAYFIEDNLEKRHVFLHLNGAYHSDNYEGIYWYLKEIDDDLEILTITTVYQDDISKLEPENIKADFIIVLPNDTPKSY